MTGAAAPVTGRDTRYEARHPIRRGALPTDRVQHTQSQEQTRKLRDTGLAAAPVGGGGAWPGFETTRRAKLAARTASGRAGLAAAGDLAGQRPEIRRAAAHERTEQTHSHTAAPTATTAQ